MEFVKNIIEIGALSRVIDWNKKRNNLELSVSLEKDMLTEELKEYFAAEDIIDKTDAVCDTLFVAVGTEAKVANNPFDKEGNIVRLADILPIEAIDVMFTDFYGCLQKEGISQNLILQFVNEAFNIVIEANEQKTAQKNKQGKVEKPKDFVKPEKKIKKLFDYYLELSEQERRKAKEQLEKGVMG